MSEFVIDSGMSVVQKNKLLERAEEIAHLGHWHLDLANERLFWSREIYNIHGVAPETFQPNLENAIHFYHSDDVAMVQNHVEKAITACGSFTFEARIVRPDGGVRHVRSSGECDVNDLGQVVSLFGVFLDITAEKNAYKDLQNRTNFLSIMMDSIPDFLFVKDQEHKLVSANNAFLGTYPPEKRDSIIGTTTIEGYDQAEADAFLKFDRIAFEEGSSEVEESILFPDNDRRVLWTKKVRFEDEDGTPYILGISKDITNLKKAQDFLKETNEELEEFTYRTSHDLRSPLVSSLALVEVVRSALERGDTEQANKSLDLAQSALKKMESFIVDLLSLAKAKNLDEDVQSVDVRDVIDNALNKFSSLEGVADIDIQVNIDTPDEISLRKSRFVLIVENMISNSIKYADFDSDKPEISLRAYCENGQLVFRVEDNGLGIPREYHKDVFKMFKRFHSRTSFGSGLGLYMMKKSADLLEGDISFSPRNKGSVFELRVPV